MAGDDIHAPKGIWSPTGGFFADPKKWKRNTVFVVGGIAVVAFSIFRTSISLEQRYGVPQHSIPSQLWTPKKNFHE